MVRYASSLQSLPSDRSFGIPLWVGITFYLGAHLIAFLIVYRKEVKQWIKNKIKN